MDLSENVAFAMPYEQITLYGKLQGAGAAAPIYAPSTPSATSSAGFMFKSHNMFSSVATDITRPSTAGIYTAKLRAGCNLPVMLDIDIKVWGPSATAKDAYVTDYNPTTRVVSFVTFLQSSAVAADLASTDFAIFVFTGTKSIPAY